VIVRRIEPEVHDGVIARRNIGRALARQGFRCGYPKGTSRPLAGWQVEASMSSVDKQTSKHATNVSELRAAIDSGKTGDKVAWPDPAAAPLGTDEEAGGTPARAQPVAGSTSRGTRYPEAKPRRGPGAGAWPMIIVSMAVIAAAGWAWLFLR
jgi:hypothetical protein